MAVVGAATAADAGELRVRAEMAKVAVAGQTETLTVRLVGADGAAVAAPRDLAVTVTVEGTDRRLRAKLPAGAEELDLRFTARAPAARTLEVVVEGHEPVWVPWVVVPAAAAQAAAVAGAADGALRAIRQVTAPPPAQRPVALPPPSTATRRDEPAGAGAEDAAMDEPAGGESAEQPATAPREAAPVTRPSRDERRHASAERVRRVLDGLVHDAQEEAVVFETAPPPPPPPAGEPVPPPAEPAAEPAAPLPASAGELRFHTPRIRLRPGSDGLYRRTVFATWFVGDVPTAPPEPVRALLTVDPDEALTLEPPRLEVPPTSDTGSVDLVAGGLGRATLRLHPGPGSLEVELLPAEPRALRFVPGLPTELRRLGPGEVRVAAELFGDALRPTLAPADLELRFAAVDGATSAECVTVVPAGAREGDCVLRLSRFGDYTLWVRAGGLEAGQGRLAFRFDLALLGWVLTGGLVGAAIQVLRHRVRSREKRLKRYLVGAAAALVVVLLLAFGGLVWLDWTLPDGLRDAAAGSSQSGLFLLGLLAGLAGDAVFSALDRRFRWTARGGAAGGGSAAGGGGTPAPAASGG
ncbi:MAG TPA: hypothetical protein VF100_11235 [Thermoanaerobaculia bacterium]